MIGRSAGCRLGSSKPDGKVRLFQSLPIFRLLIVIESLLYFNKTNL